MTDEKRTTQSLDIFIADTVYPEADQLFRTDERSVEEIKDGAVFVIDTNALLVPYSIGRDSLEQIRVAYQTVVERGQLLIPGQVAREFARNRATKITELYQQLSRKRDSITNLQKGRYPLLDSIPVYQEVVDLESQVDDLLRQYRRKIGEVLSQIQGWNWSDPVTEVYSQLFVGGVVHEPKIDKEKARDELTWRQLHKLPPGYKDGSKDDQGIGDLLIWFTILEIAQERQADVVFVSGDQKTDWWQQSENQALYPRFELVDEFRRASSGRSFRIIPFSRFLDLYGATQGAVEEVREEEQRMAETIEAYGTFLAVWVEIERTLAALAETCLSDKSHRHPAGAGMLLRQLASQGVIPQSLVSRALNLNDIRNRLVHGVLDLPATELKALAVGLAEVLTELRALQS